MPHEVPKVFSFPFPPLSFVLRSLVRSVRNSLSPKKMLQLQILALVCFPAVALCAFGNPDLEQKLVISPGYSVHEAPIVEVGKPLEVNFSINLRSDHS